VLVEAL